MGALSDAEVLAAAVCDAFMAQREKGEQAAHAAIHEINAQTLQDALEMFEHVFCEDSQDEEEEKRESRLPAIKRHYISNWDKNELYYGSWCYWNRDGRGVAACRVVQNLAHKYNNNVLFAGDWTQSGNGYAPPQIPSDFCQGWYSKFDGEETTA